MDGYKQANAIMLMIIFWQGGPVILELNLTRLFISHFSHRDTEIVRVLLPETGLFLCVNVVLFF